jgi:anaerobic sulfite reductase subunit B
MTLIVPTHDALDTPVPYRVVGRRVEGPNVGTLLVHPIDGSLPEFEPAQFSMIGVPGLGEVPISISTPVDERSWHGYTIRREGAVTDRLLRLDRGDVVTIRGPFGRPWDLDAAAERDVVFVAGGIGIAPLAAAIHVVLGDRTRFGRLSVLAAATDPTKLVYGHWLDRIGQPPDQATVRLAVDRVPDGERWEHSVGPVTELLADVVVRPETELFVCGPDPMLVATVGVARSVGVTADHVQLTLERNMHCGVGWCGHCQLGPLLLCRDGPVMRASEVGSLLEVKQL